MVFLGPDDKIGWYPERTYQSRNAETRHEAQNWFGCTSSKRKVKHNSGRGRICEQCCFIPVSYYDPEPSKFLKKIIHMCTEFTIETRCYKYYMKLYFESEYKGLVID